MTNRPVRGSLNALVKDHRSPVRQFLADRFGAGLRGVQRRYRESVPELAVAPGRAPADTVAGAADWLLRFLIHPAPDLDLVMAGVRSSRTAGAELRDAVTDVTGRLGMTSPIAPGPVQRFTGPITGSTAEPGLLARACWSFALLTETYRAGPAVLRGSSPLSQLRDRAVTGDDLLALAPQPALNAHTSIRGSWLLRRAGLASARFSGQARSDRSGPGGDRGPRTGAGPGACSR